MSDCDYTDLLDMLRMAAASGMSLCVLLDIISVFRHQIWG